MGVIVEFKKFLSDATAGQEFLITKGDVEQMTKEEAKEFSEIWNSITTRDDYILNYTRMYQGNSSDPPYTIRKNAKSASIYKDGKEDARMQEGPISDNPFRPRYRKLSTAELEAHDALKNQAFHLLGMIRDVVAVREQAGQPVSGEEHANIKLAQRHLEDAVYRAVKALTA